MRSRGVAAAIIIVLLIAAVTIAVLHGRDVSRPTAGPVKVGVILPLTGPTAYLGKAVQSGMELFIASSHANLKPVYIDSRGQATDSVSAMNKLVAVDKPPVVIDVASVPKALAPIADRTKTVLFCTATSSSGVAKSSEWAFRFFTNADTEAAMMADFATKRLGLRRFAIVYLNDEFGNSYARVFDRRVRSHGGVVVAQEAFGFGDTDFRVLLSKIKSTHPDAVYLLGYSDNLGLIPLQMKQIGLEAVVLSIGTLALQQVIHQAGEFGRGAYFTTTTFDFSRPTTPELASFVKQYTAKYKTKPEYFEVFGYDSLRLINDAVKRGGESPDGIRKALLSLKGVKGAVGDMSIGNTREVQFPLVIRQIQRGAPSETELQ